tara:strand:+ start:1721 stop:2686 length:966 start_codon:yes stop_codon:yes gene_type:complete
MSELHTKDIAEILENVREFSNRLSSLFVARQQVVKDMIIAAIAQEPLLFIGPPGTGKSELVTQFKKMLDLDETLYFEYTLTKFTEPSEILGPLDLKKMKSGEFYRRTYGKLPEASLVFLDEVFKSNSAILNTLLTVLNEKKFYQDGRPTSVPLKILFAATNEIPSISELDALKDRFTLKVKINKVPEEQWDQLLQKGLQNETTRYFNRVLNNDQIVSLADFDALYSHLQRSMQEFAETGIDPYFSKSLYFEFKRIIKTILHDFEVSISDRKLIKLYKLVRAKALFERGGGVEREDFRILMHLGNNSDEIEYLQQRLFEILV